VRGRGRVVASVVASVVLATLVAAGPVATAATAATASVASRTPAACRSVVPGSIHVLSSVKNRTPVVLVHGFSGLPADFTRTHKGVPSMASVIEGMPGAAAVTFDYSKHALDWVTDEHIGPALASAIVCLAKRSGHHVVVIGHSMGGLAAQYAQGQTVAGVPVASVMDRVVTIGTPSTGSQLLSLTSGGVSGFVLDKLLDGARSVCGNPRPTRPSRDVCDLLGAQATPAVQGLTPGSSQLASLPAWNPRLVVHAIAGDLSLYVRVLGLEQSASVGDILVSVDSATADASPGETPLVVPCRSELGDVTGVIDDSPCSHGQLLRNRRIENDVRAQVRKAVHDSGTLA
jgi:pimeloyl-ACP methyl ester carboxylesterase